ncbi:hypothetical protein GCM10027051_31440 [Niabella terrae]
MKPFMYLNRGFFPLRKFKPEEKSRGFAAIGLSTGITVNPKLGVRKRLPGTWDYEQFYEQARRAGAGDYDVFLMNGKPVVPSNRELFYLR